MAWLQFQKQHEIHIQSYNSTEAGNIKEKNGPLKKDNFDFDFNQETSPVNKEQTITIVPRELIARLTRFDK